MAYILNGQYNTMTVPPVCMLLVTALLTAAVHERYHFKLRNDLLEPSALTRHKMSPTTRTKKERRREVNRGVEGKDDCCTLFSFRAPSLSRSSPLFSLLLAVQSLSNTQVSQALLYYYPRTAEEQTQTCFIYSHMKLYVMWGQIAETALFP